MGDYESHVDSNVTSHASTLASLVEAALRGDLTFDQFSQRYLEYYLDVLPDGELTDSQSAVFSLIHEKLEWTSSVDVDAESRSFGWITAGEFMRWMTTNWKPSER